MPESRPNAERVRLHWGDCAPEWIVVLAEACDRVKSQGQVAKGLGVSGSMVNQALGNAYRGDLAKLEARVRGELMNETVDCPVLGEITTRQCLDEQARPFAATNPLRVALFRACRQGCPNFRGGNR